MSRGNASLAIRESGICILPIEHSRLLVELVVDEQVLGFSDSYLIFTSHNSFPTGINPIISEFLKVLGCNAPTRPTDESLVSFTPVSHEFSLIAVFRLKGAFDPPFLAPRMQAGKI